MGKIFYFAYGANRTQEMMNWITGKSGLTGRPAILKGWILGVQKLNQIPEVIIPTSAGPRPLRKHLQIEWGDKFETYTITPGKGEIRGTLWEINPKERELVRNWERVGFWYKEVQVKVSTGNGQEVEAITECLGDSQTFARKVNGLNYNPFLLPKDIFKVRAEQARVGYYKRMGLLGNLI
jgi:hypothetical protein